MPKYRRVIGSTNFRRVSDPSTLTPEEWRQNELSGGRNIVDLPEDPSSPLDYELCGPAVNELAGRVVVKEPPWLNEATSAGKKQESEGRISPDPMRTYQNYLTERASLQKKLNSWHASAGKTDKRRYRLQILESRLIPAIVTQIQNGSASLGLWHVD